MNRLSLGFLRSSLVLFLCVLSVPGITVFAPADAHAFGGLTENGTAAFMGIGITPTKILHVSGSGPGSVPLFVRGSDSAGFIIERTPTNRWVLGVNESPALGTGFVLSTIPTGNTSVPRLMITQNGNVGIGTTNPNEARLQVEDASDAIYAKNTSSGNYGWLGGYSYGAYGQHGATGNHGELGSEDYGAYGVAEEEYDKGVYGRNAYTNTYGYLGGGVGVYGSSANSTSYGELGTENHGVYGMYGGSGPRGALGNSGSGVWGQNTGKIAGEFSGSVYVSDNINIGGGAGASVASSRLYVAGAIATDFRTVYDPVTLDQYDSVIAADASGGGFGIGLPDATKCKGRQYTIKRLGPDGENVVINPYSTQTIDEAEDVHLTKRWQYRTIVSDGSNWLIIGGKTYEP